MSEGRQTVRKPVEFNLSNEEDRLTYDYAKTFPNFAGAVKTGFAQAQHRKMAQHSAAQVRTAQPPSK